MAARSRAKPPRQVARLGSVSAGIALAFLAGSCKRERHPPPLPPSPATLDVALRDYRLDYDPAISPGRVVLRARNAGGRTHELALLALPEDGPSIKELVSSKRPRAVATVGFLKPMRPGARGVFAVDLPPGRYGLVCPLKDADGVTHAKKGMASELRLRRRRAP